MKIFIKTFSKNVIRYCVIAARTFNVLLLPVHSIAYGRLMKAYTLVTYCFNMKFHSVKVGALREIVV